mgnify:CR=1 FL=1
MALGQNICYPPGMEKNPFKLATSFAPQGDQPRAIADLCNGLDAHARDQVLLGVTGSGKTFTMANVVAQTGRPALVMAHNKVLAGQLYEEFKEFFPDNAVEYFVSYYDYYQPEAYVPRSDTFIEKEATINEQIDRMRHSATRAMLERRDVIVIASVSCIYGIGDPESYATMTLPFAVGDTLERQAFLRRLVDLQYSRNDVHLTRGTFRARGDTIEVFPSHMETAAWRIYMFDEEVERITAFDPLTGEVLEELESVVLYPNSHYVVPKPQLKQAITAIEAELAQRLPELEQQGKLLESQRLRERTNFDLEMMKTIGYCSGIENYSRHLSGRNPGEPPPTLFDYLPDDALLFVDESHVTVPQVRGMSKGDAARKKTLVEYGFRLPSAVDNRPLTFEEWFGQRPSTMYISATPADFEMQQADGHITEQIIRPTGLVDPEVEVRPADNQVDDVMAEINATTEKGFRSLVTTLTKKMAEQLTEYLVENGMKVTYMHSDIDTLERAEIIRELRLGTYDVLVGINLLREGLDIPEVALVAILDADKEGYLRSETSLVQTIGRAARNAEGHVVCYADTMTRSLKAAIDETERRRAKQIAHNTQHGITPQSIQKRVHKHLEEEQTQEGDSKPGRRHDKGKDFAGKVAEERENLRTNLQDIPADIAALKKEMATAVENLNFERAAALRDEIQTLEKLAVVEAAF